MKPVYNLKKKNKKKLQSTIQKKKLILRNEIKKKYIKKIGLLEGEIEKTIQLEKT